MFGLAARVVLDSTQDERTKRIMTGMLELFEALQNTIFKMIDWIMGYFPIGIFALTTCNFAVYGVSLFQSYFQVALCVICGILLMLLIALMVKYRDTGSKPLISKEEEEWLNEEWE